jgi:DNA-binding transcriptional MerR regulator
MMVERKYLPTLCGFITGSASYVTLREISMLCDVHPEMVIRLVRLGLIDPVEEEKAEEAWTFSVDTVPLVRKIIRLRNELGINYSGIGVVLELLSRIDALEARIRELES